MSPKVWRCTDIPFHPQPRAQRGKMNFSDTLVRLLTPPLSSRKRDKREALIGLREKRERASSDKKEKKIIQAEMYKKELAA